jgi:hypothetical protein
MLAAYAASTGDRSCGAWWRRDGDRGDPRRVSVAV